MKNFLSVSVAIFLAALPNMASAVFFIIPLPSPKYDPDKIDATKEQRQLAMCAAFHREVVDPNLSGSRKTSWRAKVEDAVVVGLKGFESREKLITAYAKQWALQTKSSSERGQSWGRMLQTGCDNSGFPVEEKEYLEWAAKNAARATPAGIPSSGPPSSATNSSSDSSSTDVIAEQAIARCRAIGFKDGSTDFRNCAMEQIRLISGSK